VRSARTGGNPPYGFARVLVDSTGTIREKLPRGKLVQQPGCHVRVVPDDPEFVAIAFATALVFLAGVIRASLTSFRYSGEKGWNEGFASTTALTFTPPFPPNPGAMGRSSLVLMPKGASLRRPTVHHSRRNWKLKNR